MHARIVLPAIAVATLVALGCAPTTKSGRGFTLPAGDAERGKAAFVQLKCHACHNVSGIELPAPPANSAKLLTLGGEVTRPRTYGELVTSIIHPQQAVSDLLPSDRLLAAKLTPMPDVNREMTVVQMVDLVTFLSPTYRRILPLYSGDTF